LGIRRWRSAVPTSRERFSERASDLKLGKVDGAIAVTAQSGEQPVGAGENESERA
jgi:hypothetical protein